MFRADFSDHLTDVSNVASVLTEYNKQLLSGLNGSGYQSTYDQMIQKMKAAKVDDIIATINKQMQEYKAQ